MDLTAEYFDNNTPLDASQVSDKTVKVGDVIQGTGASVPPNGGRYVYVITDVIRENDKGEPLRGPSGKKSALVKARRYAVIRMYDIHDMPLPIDVRLEDETERWINHLY